MPASGQPSLFTSTHAGAAGRLDTARSRCVILQLFHKWVKHHVICHHRHQRSMRYNSVSAVYSVFSWAAESLVQQCTCWLFSFLMSRGVIGTTVHLLTIQFSHEPRSHRYNSAPAVYSVFSWAAESSVQQCTCSLFSFLTVSYTHLTLPTILRV